jgi:type IV fimbrial biogenesis protein FimT
VKTRGRQQTGFTLIELMTALAVVAIVLGVGVPGFQRFIADNRRAAQTNYVLSALAQARSEAMRSSRIVSVCPSTDGASCNGGGVGWQTGFIVFANDDGANLTTVDAADQVLEIYPALGGSFTLNASGAVQNGIAFRPTGLPISSGEFAWCDARGPTAGRAVILRPSGSAMVSKTNGAGGALSCTP